MVRMTTMSNAGGRRPQRGSVLFGIAGGMLVVAGGFIGGYYMMGPRAVAEAAKGEAPKPTAHAPSTPQNVNALLANTVDIKTVDTDGNGTVSLAEAQAVWKDLTEDAFKAADADASGELSAEELATLPAPAQ